MTCSLASCLAREPLMLFYHATSSGESLIKEEEAALCLCGFGEGI